MTLDQLQEHCLAHDLEAIICGDTMRVSIIDKFHRPVANGFLDEPLDWLSYND